MIREENIRVIFGLKLKQLRQENQLSLSELSQQSGLSASYLNEIEKGKKYPKTEKIAALAQVFGVSYDDLVSLKLSKKLAPIGDLLMTNIISDLPLEIFGLDYSRLVEWVTNAPAKVGAFMSTIIEISRNYNMQKEQFYFAALRSYQQINDNYFEELEVRVDQFLKDFEISGTPPIWDEQLIEILQQKYKYKLGQFSLEDYPELEDIRSIFVPTKKKLLLNPRLNESQKLFAVGRELAFSYLKIKDRPNVTILLKAQSFDHILHNFQASYFAAALLINRKHFVKDVKELFSASEWSDQNFAALLSKYRLSAELFFHRLSNIVPQFFGIKQLFFMRFQNVPGVDRYDLTKELHLSSLHSPHGDETNLHYCRRWVAINSLQKLAIKQNGGSKKDQIVVSTQRAEYINTNESYFCISIARPMTPTPNSNASVTIGFKINETFKRKVRFWNDDHIPTTEVNATCERCPLTDCKERASEASILHKKAKRKQVRSAVERLMEA